MGKNITAATKKKRRTNRAKKVGLPAGSLVYFGNKGEVETIIAQDPFYQHQIATYQIIEFIPTKYSEDFSKILL